MLDLLCKLSMSSIEIMAKQREWLFLLNMDLLTELTSHSYVNMNIYFSWGLMNLKEYQHEYI